jgi:hypothetical protein
MALVLLIIGYREISQIRKLRKHGQSTKGRIVYVRPKGRESVVNFAYLLRGDVYLSMFYIALPHLAALSTNALLLRYNQSEQAKSSFQHPARRDARSRKIGASKERKIGLCLPQQTLSTSIPTPTLCKIGPMRMN